MPGTVFIPCGPHANAILHADTHGTGAPDYKWMAGTVTRTETPARSGWDILAETGGAVCPDVSPHPGGQNRTGTVRDVPCPLCGCLCNDVAVRIVDNAIVSVDNACSPGSGTFHSQKFTLTPMRGHWNVNGTNQTFSYLTGFPYGVDFSRGIPYYNPGETTAADLLSKKEVDACLVIGAGPGAHLPRRCVEQMAAIPTIVIDPYIPLSTGLAGIHIPVACVGIETEGIGYRMDSVPLRMKKVLDADLPTDEQVLSGMLSYIRGAGAEAISRTAAPRCTPPDTGTAWPAYIVQNPKHLFSLPPETAARDG